MNTKSYDVAVIGVGSMGSAACYYLARAGVSVLGLEQFSIPHEKGSHAGQSRIIRKAYFEHPDYVPLLQKAYDNWRELENEHNEKLYHDTGLLYMGPENDGLLEGVRKSADLYGIEIQDVPDIASKFPKFSTPDNFEAIFEPDAGFVLPEKTITVLSREAKNLGADIMENTKVHKYELTEDGVEVFTSSGNFKAKKIILCSGAYSNNFNTDSDLSVTQQLISWVKPKSSFGYELGDFPCWVVSTGKDPGVFYGFPMLGDNFDGPSGLKLAHHDRGVATTPAEGFTFDDSREREKLSGFMNEYMPGAFDQFNEFKSCLYTYSPDDDFIIDFLPEKKNRVILAAGFSGHGFKFVPVIGEILKDLVVNGKTDLPIEFLSLKRLNDK